MLSVNVNEGFLLTAVLVDDTSMGSGETVSFEVIDSIGTTVISGTMDESVKYSGTYTKEISIAQPGNYTVYYTASGYPTGVEYIKVEESLAELIKQNRQSNLSVENVFAASDIPVRNVEAGKTDYVVIRIKRDSDPDWSNPVVERRLYAWYQNMGDDQPIYMGEEN